MSEGKKYDDGKPRTDLLPPLSLLAVAGVLSFGAAKYGDNNWRGVLASKARYTAACLRHLLQYMAGETYDQESGYHHLAHAICSLTFVLELELEAHDRSSDRRDGTGTVS